MDQALELSDDGLIDPSVSSPVRTHEESATSAGWRPKEEWDGDPEDWVDAREFNRRGEYMDRIKSQSSLIKKLEKKLTRVEGSMTQLAEHHRKVQEIEYKKALDDLKALKREALDLGDSEKVVELDDKIAEVRQAGIPQTQPVQPAEAPPEVSAWLEDNHWYESDVALQGAMDAIVGDLVKKNPQLKMNATKALEMAKEQLEEEFPHKFKKRANVVSEPSGSDGVQRKNSPDRALVKKLSAEQRQFADRFVKMGAVASLEEYAKQLHDIGEI